MSGLCDFDNIKPKLFCQIQFAAFFAISLLLLKKSRYLKINFVNNIFMLSGLREFVELYMIKTD